VTAIRVLLADDEPLVRSGLRAILESEPDLTVVGEADDGAAVVAEARRTRPDIVLMDVRMPRVDGIAATRQLGQFDGGGPAVIVVTTFENDDYVYDALQAGARGFLLKRSTAEDYINAIRTYTRESPCSFRPPSAGSPPAMAGREAAGWPRRTSPTGKPRSCGSSPRADPTRRSRPSCSSAWRP
jgi:DNA-binding NarL/FixJ family response regulator